MPLRSTLILILLTGCFDSHGIGGGGDVRRTGDGGPGGDGGPSIDGSAGPWTSCRAADEGGGREGDACTFEGVCFGDGPCSGVTTQCLRGRLDIERVVDESCPTSCADLEDDVSARPCEVDFGICTVAIDECCIGSFRCEGGFVRQVGATACDTECGVSELCEGWEPPPPEAILCTADSDCDPASESCLPPGVSLGCPVCTTDERTCASDADCPDGTHCEEYEPVCPTCDGVTPTSCFEDCVPGGCPTDETCTDGGACVPLRCDTGAIGCPANFRCTGFSGDGCARLGCERDSDCDCGSCVTGRCFDGPGVCSEPSA